MIFLVNIKNHYVLLIGLILVIIVGFSIFLSSKKVNPDIEVIQNRGVCAACNGINDTTCPANQSCVIPKGSNQGVCFPNLKPGQKINNELINQECNTNFPE